MRCSVTIYNDNATDGVDLELVIVRRNDKAPEKIVLKPTCDGKQDRGPHCLDLNTGDVVLVRIPE